MQEKVAAEKMSTQLDTMMSQLQNVGVFTNDEGGLVGLEKVQLLKHGAGSRPATVTPDRETNRRGSGGDTAGRVSLLEAEREELSAELAR